MSYKLTTISHNTTGTKSITCPFIPSSIRITTSQKGAGGDSSNHISIGDYSFDDDYQVCDSVFTDATGSKSERKTDRVVNHFERVAGSIVAKTTAHVDQATAPWERTTPPYNIKYIVDIADINYQYKVEIRA